MFNSKINIKEKILLDKKIRGNKTVKFNNAKKVYLKVKLRKNTVCSPSKFHITFSSIALNEQ